MDGVEDLTHKLNSINTGTYLEDATKKKKKNEKKNLYGSTRSCHWTGLTSLMMIGLVIFSFKDIFI